MSVSDGTTGAARRDVDRQKQQDVVIPIYPRLSQETPACFHIQVSPGATAAMVIQFAVATLDLDVTRTYILLEVTQAGGGERRLGDTEVPGERVLLWPQRARKEHLQEEGYYFILQAQGGGGAPGPGADDVGVPSLEDYDDLCSLSPLTEDTILTTLRQRFYKRKIYTYASGILVAINPFKFLTIYNPKYVTMYYNQPLGKLSPHIFAVADAAYHTMLRQQENQCVVISGESGSGKTQSTNFLIHCLTALSQKGCSSGVERTILGAGPVLEAFGNARTAQNNNSSRFGKFIQVNYLESGVVRGCVFITMLQNYHVFYYLLVGASPEEQTEFRLLQPEDYAYLQQVNTHGHIHTLCEWICRLGCLIEIGGNSTQTFLLSRIFSVLSAILYLGNVTYSQSEDGQRLKAGPEEILSTLSHLLKVKQELLVQALTERKQKTANDTLVLHYTLKEAITARDSMAKTLYSSLFDWIVLHINHALLNRRDMEESVSCLSIGILDIFGFEDFRTNSFEQFCINYANEKLHYYFNQHIFSLEQEEYKAEGICWRTVEYTDNLGCIQLISQKPTGLFSLLDEESNLPQATDDTLLGKFKKQHQNNPYFISTPVMKPAFIIHHFAGMVQYQIQDFRKKNTDHMRPDIVALLRSSELAFMRQLIGSDPVAVFRWGILRATVRIIAAFNSVGRTRAATGRLHHHLCLSPQRKIKTSKHKQLIPKVMNYEIRRIGWSVRRFIDLLCLVPQNLINSQSLKHIVGLTLYDHTTRAVLHPHQRKKPPSISAQFQASLNKLLETVGRAEPFFIRCIRSNAEKKEMVFDDALVLQQLRYTGMLETVRVRKSGYSAKFTFKEFLEKFKVLLPKGATAAPEDIAKLLQNMGLRQGTYQIGKTKVFLKDKERQRLQDAVNQEVMRNIIILQRWFRACLVRNNFLYKKDAAIRIQRCWRAFLAGNRCRAATVIQVAWRGSQKRTDYLRKRNSVQKMQELLKNKQVKKDVDFVLLHFCNSNMLFTTCDCREKTPLIKEIIKAQMKIHSKASGLGFEKGSCISCHPNTHHLAFPPQQKPQSGYKGLMVSYENRVSSLAGTKQQNEVQSVVNLFQSVLDGFIRGEIKRAEAGISKVVQNGPNSPLDHMFSTYQVNIMQSCDQCGSYIWVMEKAYMCSTCKLISHKKCLSKISTDCSTRCARLVSSIAFGVPVCVLTSQACPIPLVVQMLLEHVEMNGLYTEGIYRKSGSACHARELHQLLETNPEMATLENYSIHTVTGLVKRWLRELPDPLMTYNLYNEFLQAVELPNQSERLRVIYQKVEGLPTSNFNTLERLLFHLVRVAKEEEHNRMSANSLAIVFAPCILRSPDTTDPFLGMKDVSKTTMCVEILITEQFRRYTEKMQDILKLEFAETLAVNQLKLKRQNTVRTLLPWPFILEASSGGDMPNMDSLNPSATDRESERTLIERIKVNL
uniref:Myosin IXb n=1 Tax=Esox lucius TaxID=8010 RepID=A0AAY5K0L7_ESOLU